MWMPTLDAFGRPSFMDPIAMAWQSQAQAPEKGEKKTDRDVRRLGSFFGIDQMTLERLDELLEKRGASRERDLAKLYEVLQAARSPSRLLSAKMEEMEDGQFVTNFKRDEKIERLCERFGLNDSARCRLVELRVRRGEEVEKDFQRLAEHLALCKDPSWTAVSLVKKVTQGRLPELPDLEKVKPLMAKLDEASAMKLREVVEKRAESDLETVLGQVAQVIEVAHQPATAMLKVADTFLAGGLLSSEDLEVIRLQAKQQAKRQKQQEKAQKKQKKRKKSSSSSSSSSSGKKKKKAKKKAKKEKKKG